MRNLNIDILRMLFAVMIVVGHLGICKLIPAIVVGPLVVFFFILTGYFTMSGYEKRKNGQVSIGSFMLSKLMSFLPYLLVAAVITFVLQTVLAVDYYHYTVTEALIYSLMSFFADVSCLEMFGMGRIMGNVAVWYLSGMMFGLLVTYPILMRFGHTFSKYAAPVIGLVCLATVLRVTGTAFGPYTEVVGLTKGMLLSIGSLCLGYFAFECADRLRSLELTAFGKNMLGFIELACYALSIAMIISWQWVNTGHLEGRIPQGWYEMAISFLMFIASVLTCSGCTGISVDTTGRPFLNKVSSFLAVGSLVLYLANYYQIYFVSKMMKDQPLEEKLILAAAFIAVSFLVIYFGTRVLIRAGRYIRSRMITIETAET